MAAPSPPRFFAAWRVEASFFPMWRPPFVASSGCHLLFEDISLYDRVLHYREINQIQCNRPYDTATCYFHTAILLVRCQSL